MSQAGAFDTLREENKRLRQRLKRMGKEQPNSEIHAEGEGSQKEDRREEPRVDGRNEQPRMDNRKEQPQPDDRREEP